MLRLAGCHIRAERGHLLRRGILKRSENEEFEQPADAISWEMSLKVSHAQFQHGALLHLSA